MRDINEEELLAECNLLHEYFEGRNLETHCIPAVMGRWMNAYFSLLPRTALEEFIMCLRRTTEHQRGQNDAQLN